MSNRSTSQLTEKAGPKSTPPPPKSASQQPAGSRSTRQTTASKATAHEGMSRVEMKATTDHDWSKDGVKGARDYLVQKGFLAVDADTRLSLETLSLVLLRVAVCLKLGPASVMNENAVRAISFLLEARRAEALARIEDAVVEMAQEVRLVLAGVEQAADVRAAGDEAGDVAAELRSAAEVITRTADEQATELSTLTERVEKGLTALLERAEAVEVPLAGSGGATYASMAAAPPPTMTAENASVLARSARMGRQILVDPAAGGATGSLTGLTEMELREKANLALTLIEEKREGAAFVGATKLANGGVIFDCKDEAIATWLRQPTVIGQFVAALGGSCVYRPRRTELIAELIPVAARIEEAGFWRVVEADSGTGDGAVAGARWVKAVQRRNAGQQHAHAWVAFTTPEAANRAIDNGLFVHGRHVRVRKSDNDPQRCVRCQAYGHLVRDCKAPSSICARCAADHKTADCMAPSGDARCGNCRVDGHTAASRDCPIFVREQERKRSRDPTAGYRYIPTTDPRTWVTSATLTQREAQASENWQQVRRGTGRLAGGESGQGGGRRPDDGWAGRPRAVPVTAPSDGHPIQQSSLEDAFQRQRSRSSGGGRSGARLPLEEGELSGVNSWEAEYQAQREALPPLSTLDAFRTPRVTVTEATPHSSQAGGSPAAGSNTLSSPQVPANSVDDRDD